MSTDDTERDDTFQASRLHVSDIPGATLIRVGTGTSMRVRVSGPAKLAERIRSEVAGGTLKVSGPPGAGGGVTVVSSHGGSSVFQSGRGSVQTNVFSAGRNVVIGGRGAGMIVSTGDGVVIVDGKVISGGEGVTVIGDQGSVQVVIEVPPVTPVTVEDAGGGNYELGDIAGTLDVRLSGSGRVTAGRMAATRAAIHGSGDVRVGSVTQALRIAIHGSGDASVRAGNVDELDISIQGSGDAVFGGTARRASLSVMGSGDIRVNQVTESLTKNCMGSGDIDIHVPPRRDPGSFWD